MKILLTGRTGQVGYELEKYLRDLGTLIALDRQQMDLSNLRQVRDVIHDLRPDIIVNAAAYTSVDEAENNPEWAMLINAQAPAVMAEEAHKIGAVLLHYSTDYVFDGVRRGRLQGKLLPYTEKDVPVPINVYGRSKLAGEQKIIASGCQYVILRVSWIYGKRGNNFLLKMLKFAKDRKELFVVNDQYGAPTWSNTIASFTTEILHQAVQTPQQTDWWKRNSGIYHLAAHGKTTWYGFAKEIFSKASKLGLLDNQPPKIHGVPTYVYPVIAARPMNSLLNQRRLRQNFGLITPDWRNSLEECLLSLSN